MSAFLLTLVCAVVAAAQPPKTVLDQELYRRIEFANEHFSTSTTIGWKTDRGQMFVKYRAPDRIEPDTTGAPAEQWWYRHIDGLGDNIFAEFADAHENGEYKLTTR